MITFIKDKIKIAAVLIAAFVVSAVLIRYVFPSKSYDVNPAFLADIKSDINGFFAGMFNEQTRKHNEQMASLIQEAKTGTYKPISKGVGVLETVNGAAFRIDVNAMEWQEEKTYVINGKTIKIHVTKGEPDPSQQLLEMLSQDY